MKNYLFVFRADYSALATVPPEVNQARMEAWMDWINNITAQNKLEGGNHLNPDGRVLRTNGVITDGPFSEIKESILGYLIVRSESYAGAVELASACPILAGEDTSVEVREIAVL